MKNSVLTNKSSSSAIIISMLCLISLLITSCDNMTTSMIPDPPDVGEPDPPDVGEPPIPDPPDVGEPPIPDPPDVGEPPIPDPPDVGEPPIPDPPDVGEPDPPDVGEPPIPDPPDVGEPDPPDVGEPDPPDVGEPDPPDVGEPDPPFPILQVGDRVIVRQTAGHGIRIRDVPYGDRIGGMFDGETGIIISGPREVRDLTWVEIKWDAPVKNPQSGCGIGANVCIGWSAVVVENGTQVIHKQE